MTEAETGRQWVAVFGGSEFLPENPQYQEAYRIGKLLVKGGYGVCTGGYGGIMEAASRGGREAGGNPIGVTCGAFSNLSPNRWVSREIREKTLMDRTQRLIDIGSAFIIFPGKAGTLAELAFLWALERAGLLSGKPRILLGGIWRDLVASLVRAAFLEEGSEREFIFAGNAQEAISALDRLFTDLS